MRKKPARRSDATKKSLAHTMPHLAFFVFLADNRQYVKINFKKQCNKT